MKARMYSHKNQFEVLVSSKSYLSIENEAKAEFKSRIKLALEADFDEAIELVEIETRLLEKLTDDMVVEAYKASRGLQETILNEILTKRGISVEKIVKIAKVKIEKRDLAEMKASKEYQDAKANVGKLASFIAAKTTTPFNGLVKSISLNKTNTIIYYNILVNNNLKCCTSKNETLTFFEF